MMRVLVIGLGSMGKRRVRCLKRLPPQNTASRLWTTGRRRQRLRWMPGWSVPRPTCISATASRRWSAAYRSSPKPMPTSCCCGSSPRSSGISWSTLSPAPQCGSSVCWVQPAPSNGIKASERRRRRRALRPNGRRWLASREGGERRVVPSDEALASPPMRYSGLAHSSAPTEKQLATGEVEEPRRKAPKRARGGLKGGNHCHAPALSFVWYNFVKIHKAHKLTPAMAAGITDKLWSVEDIVALVEASEPKPRKRGPYKERAAWSAVQVSDILRR